jgi:alkylation response protein AidB-like acyl-CoA dehydrogenase
MTRPVALAATRSAPLHTPPGPDEARQFAHTVRAIVARHARPDRRLPDPWRPGAAVSDADAALDDALREAGWDELGTDEQLLPLAAPAAAELGRAFATLAPVDRLLGGALCVDGLARYAEEGGELVEPRAGLLLRASVGRPELLPYTDALGVCTVSGPREPELPAAGPRMAAWCAASTGYLAGLAEESLRLALEHARSRHAFGGPLTALEPVQQSLADAATLVDGLTLLTGAQPGADALAHAGEAAERAVAICMQVTGALGFTLEFPLQRAYRRGRSARSWADAVLAAWERPAR